MCSKTFVHTTKSKTPSRNGRAVASPWTDSDAAHAMSTDTVYGVSLRPPDPRSSTHSERLLSGSERRLTVHSVTDAAGKRILGGDNSFVSWLTAGKARRNPTPPVRPEPRYCRQTLRSEAPGRGPLEAFAAAKLDCVWRQGLHSQTMRGP